MLVEHYGGEVPVDMDALETFPGVGHKTASVVMSQAFDVPAFAVDTHIHRLAQRWGLTNGKNVVQTEKDLKCLFPKTAGINFTYKSFTTEESTAPQGAATVLAALFALPATPTVRNLKSC
jgi:endonuclease III